MTKTFLFQAIQFSQTIQFSINMPWVLFISKIGPYQVPEWSWEQWQWRGAPHYPKLQHQWNLTIRLFSVISRTLIGVGVYPSAEVQSVYSTAWADSASFYPWLLFVFYLLECKGWILNSFGGGNFWSGGIVRYLWVCGRYLWWFGH